MSDGVFRSEMCADQETSPGQRSTCKICTWCSDLSCFVVEPQLGHPCSVSSQLIFSPSSVSSFPLLHRPRLSFSHHCSYCGRATLGKRRLFATNGDPITTQRWVGLTATLEIWSRNREDLTITDTTKDLIKCEEHYNIIDTSAKREPFECMTNGASQAELAIIVFPAVEN